MKPWEIPDDEFGNAGWINLDRMLEDEDINLTLARLWNHPDEKIYEQRVRDLLKSYIREIEEIELIQKYKKYFDEEIGI